MKGLRRSRTESEMLILSSCNALYNNMNRLRAIIAGIALITTAVTLSSFAPSFLVEVVAFKNEIFRTNCLLQVRSSFQNSSGLLELPQICNTINELVPVFLLTNGVMLCLFGLTRATTFMTMLNLMFFIAFYCNPLIDSSFRSYSHFLQVAICIGVFLKYQCREKDEKKEHRE